MKKCISIIFASLFLHVCNAHLKFDTYVIEENLAAGTSVYNFSFSFKNAGKSTIKITDVKTDCGCTVIQNDKIIYSPCETGILKGIFNVGDRIGVQDKEIYIHTDNIGQSTIKLLLKIQIQPIVTLKPSLVFWKKGEENSEKAVSLILNDKTNPELVSIESDNENISVVKIKDKENSRNYLLKIKPKTTSENARGLIKVKVRQNDSEKIFFIHALVK